MVPQERGFPDSLELRFEPLGLIGQGGMGTVFRARERSSDRIVAVKLLKEISGEDRARFRREVGLVTGIEHPSILRVHEGSFTDDGQPYVVMECVEAPDLRRMLEERIALDEHVVRILDSISRALDHAHAAGIVHRDVKPENILVGRDRVALCDFGIARSIAAGSTVTRAGVLLGTPLYIAPELVTGAPASPRSDQFALGVVACELVTGRVPFEGSTVLELLTKRLSPPYIAVSELRPGLPKALHAVMERAIHFRPEARYPTCTEFAVALAGVWREHLREPSPRASRTVRLSVRAPSDPLRTSRAPRLPLALCAATVLVLVVFLAGRVRQVPAPERSSVALASPSSTPASRAPSAAIAERLAQILPEPSAALSVELDKLSDGLGTSGKSQTTLLRRLLKPPLSEEIERLLRAMRAFALIPADQCGDCVWLDVASKLTSRMSNATLPMIAVLSQFRYAFNADAGWTEKELEVTRVALERALTDLETALEGATGSEQAHDVARRRLLADVKYHRFRVSRSASSLIDAELKALFSDTQHARDLYVDALLDCAERAAARWSNGSCRDELARAEVEALIGAVVKLDLSGARSPARLLKRAVERVLDHLNSRRRTSNEVLERLLVRTLVLDVKHLGVQEAALVKALAEIVEARGSLAAWPLLVRSYSGVQQEEFERKLERHATGTLSVAPLLEALRRSDRALPQTKSPGGGR